MAITPDDRLRQFITDGGIETHIIFNMGVELPHFWDFPLNDSAAGRDVSTKLLPRLPARGPDRVSQLPICLRQLARKCRLGRPARL